MGNPLRLPALGFALFACCGIPPAQAAEILLAAVSKTYFDPQWNFVVSGYACSPTNDALLWMELYPRDARDPAARIGKSLADIGAAEARTVDGEGPTPCAKKASGWHIFRINVAPDMVRSHAGMTLQVRTQTGAAVTGATIELPLHPVVGKFASTSFRSEETFITGWACQPGVATALTVKIYRGGVPGSAAAVYLGSAVANLSSSEVQAQRACPGIRSGFEFKISQELRKSYPGQRVYAQAIAADAGSSPNYPLDGQSRIHAQYVFPVASPGPGDATDAIKTAITQAIKAAASYGAGEVVLGKGVYNVGLCPPPVPQHAACFELSNINKGRLIVGGDEQGTEILMHQIATGAFQARTGSNDLSLMDLSIDYATPGFTQGKIVRIQGGGGNSADAETLADIDFDGDPQFPSMVELCDGPVDQQAAKFKAQNQWGYIADRSERGLKHDTPSFWFPNSCEKVAVAGANRWRLHMHRFFAQFAQVNDRYVQIVTRSNAVLFFSECNNINLDNVTIHAGGGAATTWVRNTGQITVDHFRVAFDDPTDRLMTTTADAFIAQGNWAPITIRNSRFEGMGDDAINIHSTGCFVGSTTMQGGTTFQIVTSQGFDCSAFYHIGDEVQVVSPENARIKGIAKVLLLNRPAGESKSLMTLDRAIPGLSLGTLPGAVRGGTYNADIVYNVSGSSPGSIIANNYFGRFRGHAIVDKSTGSQIIENVFHNVNGPAMSFGQILGSTEGPLPSNIQISDNVVDGSDWTGGPPTRSPSQVDVIAGNFTGNAVDGASGLVFRHNQFLNATGLVFDISGAANLSIIDNYVEAAPTVRRPIPGTIINMQGAKHVVINSLHIEDPRPATRAPVASDDPSLQLSDVSLNVAR